MRIALFIAAASTAATHAHAADLFGTTITNQATDTSRFVQIDPATGAATPMFTFDVPDGAVAARLTHHDSSRTFKSIFLNLADASQSRLATIDPATQTVNSVPITGLPAGTGAIEGFGYDAPNDRLLITFGATVATTRVAQIGLDGAVVDLSDPIPGIDDLDNLEYDDFNGRLVVSDFNRVIAPRVLAIDDPFAAAPNVSSLLNLTSNSDVGDMAIDPDTGDMFATGFGASNQMLVSVDAFGYADVGSYGIDENVGGIAFVPAPATLSLLSIGALAARRRR